MVIKLLTTTLANQGLNLVEELAKTPSPNHRIVQYLAVLQKECDRELSLVKDLLSLQHPDAETYSDQITAVRLQDWLPHIIEPFETQVQNQQ